MTNNIIYNERDDPEAFYHIKRPRLSQLLSKAVKYSLTIVCAGEGYGKTTAVHDFVKEYEDAVTWMSISKRDNVADCFWGNFIYNISQINTCFANYLSKLGFPDTEDKLDQYLLAYEGIESRPRIIVIEDFHLIDDDDVLRFIEKGLIETQAGTSVILISRFVPGRIVRLTARHNILNIDENDSVADLCTGNGSFIIDAYRENTNAQYLGVEINTALAAIASIRAEI